jgi:hypothetical protein
MILLGIVGKIIKIEGLGVRWTHFILGMGVEWVELWGGGLGIRFPLMTMMPS